MGIFDINFTTKVSELSPVDKREVGTLAWLKSLIKPIQYLRDKILGEYRTGTTYPTIIGDVYDPSNTYNIPDVAFYNGVSYTCNTNGTTGAWNPIYWNVAIYAAGDKFIYKQIVYEVVNATGEVPPTANWTIYLPSFLGVDNRIKFDGILVTLTYALNNYWSTTFRQPLLLGWSLTPDSDHAQYSDIWIETVPFDIVGFIVGTTEPYCSTVGQTTSSDTINYNYPFAHVKNFIIHIPLAVVTDTPEHESEIRNFVDKIIPAGLHYILEYY